MAGTTRHVLKASEVRFEGVFHLDLGVGAASASARTGPGSAPARIRIAENHADYAIVEVICSCGKTTYVRCEYNSATASPVAAMNSRKQEPGAGALKPLPAGSGTGGAK